MISHKKEINGINEDPNSIITNLLSRAIDNDEYKILTYGLKYGIAVSAKENSILASSEALLDQLEQNKYLKKENFRSIQRAKKCYLCSEF